MDNGLLKMIIGVLYIIVVTGCLILAIEYFEKDKPNHRRLNINGSINSYYQETIG